MKVPGEWTEVSTMLLSQSHLSLPTATSEFFLLEAYTHNLSRMTSKRIT